MVDNYLSFPQGGLALVRHDDTAEECGILRDWDLTSSDSLYKPLTKTSTVQGERTGARAHRVESAVNVGKYIKVESHRDGIEGRNGSEAAKTGYVTGKFMAPEETRADISSHNL